MGTSSLKLPHNHWFFYIFLLYVLASAHYIPHISQTRTFHSMSYRNLSQLPDYLSVHSLCQSHPCNPSSFVLVLYSLLFGVGVSSLGSSRGRISICSYFLHSSWLPWMYYQDHLFLYFILLQNILWHLLH